MAHLLGVRIEEQNGQICELIKNCQWEFKDEIDFCVYLSPYVLNFSPSLQPAPTGPHHWSFKVLVCLASDCSMSEWIYLSEMRYFWCKIWLFDAKHDSLWWSLFLWPRDVISNISACYSMGSTPGTLICTWASLNLVENHSSLALSPVPSSSMALVKMMILKLWS